jgi:two-component system cell cycle sensor histidine kinase/response regulator CckA
LLKEVAVDAAEGRTVTLDFDTETGLWPALFDDVQISRVVEVLIQNAYQSMLDNSERPRIKIIAQNVELVDNEVSGLCSGKYVRVSITDNGTGIPDEILERIFEPYFSTKGAGRGLGLATVYSILQHHQGVITVDTHIGAGSTFTFYLPFAAEKKGANSARRKPKNENTRRILFMDDDEFIRDAFTDVLVNMGYSVASARNGEEALELLKTSFQDERFAAIILDLHVENGLGAKDIIGTIREMEPDLPVFLASGTADDPSMSDFERLGFSDKMEKPFKRKELSSLLRNYMNG